MTIPVDFHVEVCDWTHSVDRDALCAVREAVFVTEQRVPRELEQDADDPLSLHVLARTFDGTPIGTGRLTPDPAPGDAARSAGRIGRMTVAREWRRHGVGSTLLHTLLDLARTCGLDSVALHAQRDAVSFYLAHGFHIEGEPFEEAGIQHQKMRRAIVPRAPPPRVAPPSTIHPAMLRADSHEELIAVTRKLLSGARHQASVLVRELHPLLLNDTACMVELRRLAISGRGASIRILTQDLTRALNENMRILELAQRLSSVIEIRRPLEPADQAYPSAFMCVDTAGYLFRPQASALIAVGSTHAPGRHAELMRRFEAIWSRSEPWPEPRALGI